LRGLISADVLMRPLAAIPMSERGCPACGGSAPRQKESASHQAGGYRKQAHAILQGHVAAEVEPAAARQRLHPYMVLEEAQANVSNSTAWPGLQFVDAGGQRRVLQKLPHKALLRNLVINVQLEHPAGAVSVESSRGGLHKILGSGDGAEEFHWVACDPGRWIRRIVIEVVAVDKGRHQGSKVR
jgi:hypothetical protein